MILDVDTLRRRLARIREKTASAATGDVSPGCFVGDKAAERRLLDNARAGRLEWSAAHNRAKLGLAQLDAIALAREALLAAVEADDAEAIDRETAALWLGLEIAEAALGEAEGLYANALEARSTQKDIADLGKSAALRGRPSIEDGENKRRLAEAVARCRRPGRAWLKTAIALALETDPVLAEAFRGADHREVIDAYYVGKSLLR